MTAVHCHVRAVRVLLCLGLAFLSLRDAPVVLGQTLPDLKFLEQRNFPYALSDIATSREGALWVLEDITSTDVGLVGYTRSGQTITTSTFMNFHPTFVLPLADSVVTLVQTSCSPCSISVRTYHFTGTTQLVASFKAAVPCSDIIDAVAGTDSTIYLLAGGACVEAYDAITGSHVSSTDVANPSADFSSVPALSIDPNGTLFTAADDEMPGGSHVFNIYKVRPGASTGSRFAVTYLPQELANNLSGDLFMAFGPQGGLNRDAVEVYGQTGTQHLAQVLRSPHSWTISGIATDPRCGIHVAIDSAGTRFVRTFISDKDGDGLCDSWEVRGIQTEYAYSNFTLSGADINHKDLYLEIDAMSDGISSRAPSQTVIDSVVAAFAKAPSDSMIPSNPDNNPGIALHVLNDEDDLTLQGFPKPLWAPVFDPIKKAHLGPPSDHSAGNKAGLWRARDRVYRYCVFGDTLDRAYGRKYGTNRRIVSPPTGMSRDYWCRDLVVALGRARWGNMLWIGGTDGQQMSTLTHELGHAIGLYHGGAPNDNNAFKPNYRSVMNYKWGPSVRNLPKWRLQFSPRAYNTLNEGSLNENTGIGGEVGDSVLVPRQGSVREDWLPESGAIDWNRNGNNTESGVVAPYIDTSPATSILQSYCDWKLIKLSPANNTTFTESTVRDELTYDDWERNDFGYCDCNRNDVGDAREILFGDTPDANSNGIPDDCERTRVSLSDTLLVCDPRGFAGNITMNVDVDNMCKYDSTATFGTLPVSAVTAILRRQAGGNVRLWNQYGVANDTLICNAQTAPFQYLLGFAGVSGHGYVYFDVYVFGEFLASTSLLSIRSFDCDTLVTGVVDRFDMDRVRAAMGGTSPRWLDFDNDGFITDADTLLMANELGTAIRRDMTVPAGTEYYQYGASIPAQWNAGYGDSCLVTIYFARDSYPDERLIVAENLVDSGSHTFAAVPRFHGPGNDYRVWMLRTAGRRRADGSNEFYNAGAGGTVTIAPRPVTGLTATLGKITGALSWTESGQADTTADEYDIRYNINATVTELNFNGLGSVTGAGVPGDSGTFHCVDLDSLTACRTYYFGVKTRFGSIWSPLSTIASGNTKCTGSMMAFCAFPDLLAGGGGGDESLRHRETSALSSVGARVADAEDESGENSLFPGGGQGMGLDRYKLPTLPIEDGRYVVNLREVGTRSALLDQVRIATVDHETNVECVALAEGVALGQTRPVQLITDSVGRSVDFSEPVELGLEETLRIRLEPAQGSQVILVSLKAPVVEPMTDSSGVAVLAREGDDWSTVGLLHPRRAVDEFAAEVGNATEVLLVSAGHYTAYGVRQMSLQERRGLELLAPADARHSRTGSVTGSARDADGTTIAMVPGDSLRLEWTVPSQGAASIRDAFLIVQGAYESGRLLAPPSEEPQARVVMQAAYVTALGLSHPNPSIGTCSISYSLAVASEMTMSVFDVAGRRVKTLYDGPQSAGPHEIIWDGTTERGSRASSGMYFYRMQTGAWRSQRKVVIVRN